MDASEDVDGAARRRGRPRMAAMREEYSLTGLAESDLAADWVEPVRPVARRTRSSPVCPSRTQWCWRPRRRPVRWPAAPCCARALMRPASSSTRTGFGQEPRPRGQPPGGGDVPVDRVAASGARARRRSGGVATSWPSVLGEPAARVAARCVGQPAVVRPARPGRPGTAADRGRPSGSAALPGSRARRPIPVPDFWGGWRIIPETVEFWQGRRPGCTTGCATAARCGLPIRRPAGSSNAWPRDGPGRPGTTATPPTGPTRQ